MIYSDSIDCWNFSFSLFYQVAGQVDILTGRVHKEKISLTLSSILSNLKTKSVKNVSLSEKILALKTISVLILKTRTKAVLAMV